MEPEGSLPHSQVPATCPYPEPDQSSSRPHPTSEDTPYVILLSTPEFSKWSLSLRFLHQTLNATLLSPIRATCPTNLIPLDLITRIIFGEKYQSLNLLSDFNNIPK